MPEWLCLKMSRLFLGMKLGRWVGGIACVLYFRCQMTVKLDPLFDQSMPFFVECIRILKMSGPENGTLVRHFSDMRLYFNIF